MKLFPGYILYLLANLGLSNSDLVTTWASAIKIDIVDIHCKYNTWY